MLSMAKSQVQEVERADKVRGAWCNKCEYLVRFRFVCLSLAPTPLSAWFGRHSFSRVWFCAHDNLQKRLQGLKRS